MKFKRILSTFVILFVALSIFLPASVLAESNSLNEDDRINEIINTPYASFFGINPDIHNENEFDGKSLNEVKTIIRSDLINTIGLINDGKEVYWNAYYVENIIKEEFPDLYLTISEQYTSRKNTLLQEISKLSSSHNKNTIARASSGSKNVDDEISYTAGTWKLHVASRFKFSWDSSGNITISNRTYYVYSDSAPVLAQGSNPWNNGTPNATVSYSYGFSKDIIVGTEYYMIQYIPKTDGTYLRNPL